MKHTYKRILSLSVITAFVFTSPLGTVVHAEKKEGDQGKAQVVRQAKEMNDVEQDERQKQEKPVELIKEELKANRKEIEEQKQQIEERKDQLEESLEALNEEDDPALYEEMKLELEATLEEFQQIKEEIKKMKLEMKEIIKSSYTEEEMADLAEKAEQIQEQNQDTVVIDVENIITRKMNLKFDTPPVIKSGRTLIPVRAITEGFGADVAWNQEEKIVTITKGDLEMVFQLEDGKVFVDGEETAIDVPAQLMNNRTIVPLRFIVEHLGLKINYDEETEIIEIDEEVDGQNQDVVGVVEGEAVVEDAEDEVVVETVEDDSVMIESVEEDAPSEESQQ